MTDFYRGRKVMVTGGLGFIGSNVAIRLAEMGAEVLLVQRQELILSLAGQISHSESMRDPMTDLEINCRSQLSLLECCRHRNRDAKVVFASTRQLYGRPQYLPVDEAHPLTPADVNGINKLAEERYYTLYNEVYDIATVSLRPTNTYGPRMEIGNDKKRFAGIFIRKALRGETIQIFGTGEQKRDFNYIDDVVSALLLAGEFDSVNGQVFNLGHSEPRSLLDFVDLLREATGWNPEIDLDVGLPRTIEWYRAEGWLPAP